jgi:hypothetical protein
LQRRQQLQQVGFSRINVLGSSSNRRLHILLKNYPLGVNDLVQH